MQQRRNDPTKEKSTASTSSSPSTSHPDHSRRLTPPPHIFLPFLTCFLRSADPKIAQLQPSTCPAEPTPCNQPPSRPFSPISRDFQKDEGISFWELEIRPFSL
ncbi:hypothetical protein AABB24_001844 [Solanum stoloniferum]|uniref:Uncharacterized protein n=1 Tax=Solanum stoloniferum TaxID=62892 RepID=A0ABD2RW17_9SOLN